LSLFVDSSVWFASILARDRGDARAKSILRDAPELVTSDHVAVETWLLLNSRFHRRGAESFWDGVRRGGVRVELVTGIDMQAAWAIGERFADQTFSIVDRTSFA